MNPEQAKVAEAFSRKALVYNTFGMNYENLTRMRDKVRSHALSFLRPGDRILELNAGTGADAAFFARNGFSVHATELSPGMVSQIQAKIQAYGLQGRLSAQLCSFTELDKVQGGPFQAIFSNMGGINCIPDLAPVARSLRRHFVPGGTVTWVVMPPVCPWELALVLHGDFKTARRRLFPHGVQANVEGVQFTTYYFTPRQVMAAFGDQFQLVKLEGLSVFAPPADRKFFSRKHPRLYRLYCVLDDLLSGRAPFNRWGDFFILTVHYRPDI